MNDRFRRALAFLADREGGYSNRTADRGGPTMRGITQRTYDAARARAGLGPRPVRQMTVEEGQAIFEGEYWNAGHCHELPERLGVAHFDACVNHGPHQAAVLMQRALGVDDDGVIGHDTLRAAHSLDESAVIRAYVAERGAFYLAITRTDPTQLANLKGWRNRLDELKRVLL